MGATHSAPPANHAATILDASRLLKEVARAPQMQQRPNPRKVKVYTSRRPYLMAIGTHKRFETPAARVVVENSKAALVTPDVNAEIESGDRVLGSRRSGGYAQKRSMTIETRRVEGPAAKKLTQVKAAQVSKHT